MNSEIKIEFIDTSKECIDLMKKYAKEGLKESGKVITKIIKDDIKENHYKTGGLYKSIVAWAKIDYKTGQPYMELGYRSRAQMKKRGIKYYVNPWWLEFGFNSHTIMTKEFNSSKKLSYELHDNMGNKFGFIVQHPGKTGKNLLRNTVYNNIKEIRESQIESLSKINDIKITNGLMIDLGGDEEIG
jgi:hypothetical protein|nr:MAG TPA_asm: hypothetical protein [Caudoviricetes sp.]